MANTYKRVTDNLVLEIKFEVIRYLLEPSDPFEKEIIDNRIKIMSQRFLDKHKDQLFDMFDDLLNNEKELK